MHQHLSFYHKRLPWTYGCIQYHPGTVTDTRSLSHWYPLFFVNASVNSKCVCITGIHANRHFTFWKKFGGNPCCSGSGDAPLNFDRTLPSFRFTAVIWKIIKKKARGREESSLMRGRKVWWWCGFPRFLVWFCGNFYFNLRYCRQFHKTKRFVVFRNFGVFSMQFAFFLCYSVQCLYIYLCSFVVFLPPLCPPLWSLQDAYTNFSYSQCMTLKQQMTKQIMSFRCGKVTFNSSLHLVLPWQNVYFPAPQHEGRSGSSVTKKSPRFSKQQMFLHNLMILFRPQ